MKPRRATKRNSAMSLFEAGVVIAIVVILVALTGLFDRGYPKRPRKVNCINNLKEIGLACKIWEGDNGDVFPMDISVTNGGSMESVVTGDVVSTFQVMSNELSTPTILICPQDARSMATSFTGLTISNISYFVGIDATDGPSQMFLSGDGNFEIRGVPVKSGLQSFGTNDPVDWSARRHVNAGNIGLTDGSVQSVSSAQLHDLFVETGQATNRLAIP